MRRVAMMIVGAATLCCTLHATAEITLDDRLDRIVSELEKQRSQMHTPGMALAVVKDGEVVLVRGFGVVDIETQEPVTPETRFAIGSTTKAMTATIAGMLVDEGLMDWDDRVE